MNGTYACPICLRESPHTHDTVNGIILVDLDGTLAEQAHDGPYDIGKPIPAMVERVKGWLAKGYNVALWTSRLTQSSVEPRNVGKVETAIYRWCVEHIHPDGLSMVISKPHGVLAIWDDRAVQVIRDTGMPAEYAVNQEVKP